jgi:phospholipid N-methyltransferase
MSNKTNQAGVRLGSALQFLGGFVREPMTIGALWPSSTTLSRVVVDSCEFEPTDTVVELGPGVGSFTKLLLDRVDDQGELLAFEVNERNVAALRHDLPRCRAIHESAEHMGRYLEARKARCVVSGLAWGNMGPRTQDRIMNAITSSLASNGQFVAFAYVHARYYPTTLRFRQLMFRSFTRVETTPIIWRNLPPAYVYRCWR